MVSPYNNVINRNGEICQIIPNNQLQDTNNIDQLINGIKTTSLELLQLESSANKDILIHYNPSNMMYQKRLNANENNGNMTSIYEYFFNEYDKTISLKRLQLYSYIQEIFKQFNGTDLNAMVATNFPETIKTYKERFTQLVNTLQNGQTTEIEAKTIFTSLLTLANYHLWAVAPPKPTREMERQLFLRQKTESADLEIYSAVYDGIQANHIRYISIKNFAESFLESYSTICKKLSDLDLSMINVSTLQQLQHDFDAFAIRASCFSDAAFKALANKKDYQNITYDMEIREKRMQDDDDNEDLRDMKRMQI